MNGAGVLAVTVGASLGALLRWGLGLLFNSLHSALAFGTLAANLLGAYLMGLALAWVAHGAVPEHYRLFVMTGFLGGLTTFSSFSAETVGLLMRGQTGWAIAEIGLHVTGSLLLTLLGILSVQWLRS